MSRRRRAFDVSGTVQGVGFRPHVARLAAAHGLGGWVANVDGGVRIEAEGEADALARFARGLTERAPVRARVERVASAPRAPLGERTFRVRSPAAGDDAPTRHARPDRHRRDGIPRVDDDGVRGGSIAPVAPDAASCAACLAEILDPRDRRHRYPFTSCTDCGPRYSIVESLPYERAHTTMRHFPPCAACIAEVEAVDDRRFHAQANACPDCGPSLTLLAPDGTRIARRDGALVAAARALADGAIVALKGLGGYQLLVDATRSVAVRTLRRRKARPHKPFALLLADLDAVGRHADVAAAEATALASTAAPIVLLRRRPAPVAGAPPIARAVAPATSLLGVMLPCTPLHHLLVRALGRPLVATSGNRAGEPIAVDEDEALARLGGIADLFLAHDRPIARALDDSVERVVGEDIVPIRRARGHAPLTIALPRALAPTLALGAQAKNAVALVAGREAVLGEHVGDLGTGLAREAHARAARTLPRLLGVVPQAFACDAHPDYHSTASATALADAPLLFGHGASVDDAGGHDAVGHGAIAPPGARPTRPVVRVPHHLAHLVACLADDARVDPARGPALGVLWDGTGHGADGTVWGGEFLHLVDGVARRVAHLHPFRLPGGERAVTEPRRAALGALLALIGERRLVALADGAATGEGGPPATAAAERAARRLLDTFAPEARALLARSAARGLAAPTTSSAGRLFDAVAALLGLVRRTSHEGQAGAMLETLAERDGAAVATLPSPALVAAATPAGALVLDWRPTLGALVRARESGVSRAALARAFHAALVVGIVDVARAVGEPRVALSGGCFQNARLLGGATRALADAGFVPTRHRRVPPNDGGLALGQAIVAATALATDRPPGNVDHRTEESATCV